MSALQMLIGIFLFLLILTTGCLLVSFSSTPEPVVPTVETICERHVVQTPGGHIDTIDTCTFSNATCYIYLGSLSCIPRPK